MINKKQFQYIKDLQNLAQIAAQIKFHITFCTILLSNI